MKSKILGIIDRNIGKMDNLTGYEWSIFDKIQNCRTKRVPNTYYCCDHCGDLHAVFKSCRDRMCPLCNGSSSLKWVSKRETELLPTTYFMITYTIPSELRSIFLYNKKICYNLLFKASSQSLTKRIETGFRSFKGKAGFYALLHTWDQKINHHPHIHIVIPSGCLSSDKTSWNKSLPAFILPIYQLSADFKKQLLYYLKKERNAGSLLIPPDITDLNKLLIKLEEVKWVVYSEPPKKKSKPEHILRYLSRYVKKTAISDDRIINIKDGSVHIKYFDRKRQKPGVEIISEELFLKKYILHILPKGFQKVRAYGFMANRNRKQMLALCKILLGSPIDEQNQDRDITTNDIVFLYWKYFRIDINLCSNCKKGHMNLVYGYFKGG